VLFMSGQSAGYEPRASGARLTSGDENPASTRNTGFSLCFSCVTDFISLPGGALGPRTRMNPASGVTQASACAFWLVARIPRTDV
jgi:hypothetical protein